MKARARQRARARSSAAGHPADRTPAADPLNIPYPVTLVRDDADKIEWVATVDALPGCSARGETPDQALEHVAAAVVSWVDTAQREGKDVPEPKSVQSHSGRLLLRMPQTLHAELSRVAEREGISLNQFITDALAGSLGWRAPARKGPSATRPVPAGGFETGAVGAKDEPRGVAGESQRRLRVTTAVFVANGIIVAVAAVVAIVVLIAALR